MSTFELYRKSTIGDYLTQTLDEMVQNGTLTPELAIQVLIQFDKSMTEALESQVKTKVSIKHDLVKLSYLLENNLIYGSKTVALHEDARVLVLKRIALAGIRVLGHLHTYRFCDNVWTFILQDAVFKSEDCQENVSHVKIVACDSKLLTQ